MNRLATFSWVCVLAFLHTSAFAQATPDVSIVNTVTQSMAGAANTVMPQAIMWLSSFIALQFFITNFGLIKSGGDIEAVMGKFIGSMAWFGFCFYILANGPDFIDSVGNGVLNKFAPNLPTPGSIIASTLGLCSSLMFAIVVTGTSVVGTGNSAVANVLVIAMFFIFAVGMYMAIKVMMLSLELGIITLLAPLSFSFLGLNALKDQGIAPLKSLISLVYRIILLGIMCAAFGQVSKVAGVALTSIDWASPTGWGKALTVIMSMLCAYPLLVYLVYKSDSIASSLASGSTNMGPGDVASAAAAGAAAGAAIASGGASAVAGAGKVPQGVGDVMKGLIGNGGGSISNASSRGLGGQSAFSEAPRRPPAMSQSFPVSSSGAPRRPADPQSGAAQSSGRSPSGVNSGAAPSRMAGAANDVSSKPEVQGAPGEQSSVGSQAQPARTAASGAQPDRSRSFGPDPVSGGSAGQGGSDGRKAERSEDLGSGADAAIAGPANPLEQKVGELVDVLKQNKKPTATDRLKEAGGHIEKERAHTSVSINTHHSD